MVFLFLEMYPKDFKGLIKNMNLDKMCKCKEIQLKKQQHTHTHIDEKMGPKLAYG